jgi:hypothetical protein
LILIKKNCLKKFKLFIQSPQSSRPKIHKPFKLFIQSPQSSRPKIHKPFSYSFILSTRSPYASPKQQLDPSTISAQNSPTPWSSSCSKPSQRRKMHRRT